MAPESVRETNDGRIMRTLSVVLLVVAGILAVVPSTGDAQVVYQRISGEGSSWSANAIDAMRVNLRQSGITVDYNPSGSSAGRKNFLNGTVDFAASDVPFQFEPDDGSAPESPAPGSYAYIPATAGGTAFIYNLKIDGERVTNLRLSGENIAKIFTGVITQWNDPAIAADNPGLTMPARTIVPVVRSDGSGSSAQFTTWMIARHKGIWEAFCAATGRADTCGSTLFYPTPPGGIAQSGDVGVAGYVSQGFAEGAIGYVNYSYALGVQFPVAKVLNAAGYYTEPTPQNVAVSLLQARINTDESNPATYLTQDLSGVYSDADPRNYELSSYSYFILPTRIGGQINEAKGRTLAAFAYYAMCEAQQQSASLGYAPLPVNLVTASFDQIAKIPGAEVQDINVQSCDNPTFSPSGENLLAANAPQPQACDKQGPAQCSTGPGGGPDDPAGTRGSFTVVEPSGPCLVVRNTAVDFGELVAGEATATGADQTTEVENCGDTPLEVSVRVGDAESVEPDSDTFLRAVPCALGPPDRAGCPEDISATSFGYGSIARGSGPEPTSVFPTGVVSVRPGAPVDLEHFVTAPGVGAPTSPFEFIVTYTAVATD